MVSGKKWLWLAEKSHPNKQQETNIKSEKVDAGSMREPYMKAN